MGPMSRTGDLTTKISSYNGLFRRGDPTPNWIGCSKRYVSIYTLLLLISNFSFDMIKIIQHDLYVFFTENTN